MSAILEQRRRSAADELAGIVTEAEQMMARDDFDPDSTTYTALREQREAVQDQLADVLATINARNLSTGPAPIEHAGGEELSPLRRMLREYDRGMSERFDIPYEIQRAYSVLETGEPAFSSSPTRIQVSDLPVLTPTLDTIRTLSTGQHYDFVVAPPPVPAGTVHELDQKPRVEFKSVQLEGRLETDAHILDVSRQTLEDDSAAEKLLRAWLKEGVRLRQDAKASAAIAGATGTLTAIGDTLLQSIRFGKAELSKLGLTASAFYLNPDDAAANDIEAMTIGHTGPVSVTMPWGMLAIENPGIPAGTVIVGAMKHAVYMPFRSAISTYITDSGMTLEDTPRDRFSHNILGILGEGRSTVHVVQPQMLVKCTTATRPARRSS